MKSSRKVFGLVMVLLAAGPAWGQDSLALQGMSVTVLPLRLEVEGRPTGGEIAVRFAEVLGLMLENAGMGEVEIAEDGWTPVAADYAAAFGRRVREQPPSTDTALWVRFAGARGLERIDWVLCGRDGRVLAQSTPAPGEPVPGDPMEACLAVAQSLQTGSDLGDPTRQPATEGSMARRMRERSGLPPPSEVEKAKARLAGLEGSLAAGCTVYPVRVAGPDQADAAVARMLTERLNAAGLGPATAATAPDMTLEVPGDPNQMKVLWDTARAFRTWLQAHPAEQPYALLVECGPVPEVRYVHVFLCDRNGDWVVVDMQNNHHDNFQRVAPDSVEGCLDLAVQRLQSRIRNAPAR